MRSMNYFSVSTKAFSTADQAYHNKLRMKKAAVFPLPLSLFSESQTSSILNLKRFLTLCGASYIFTKLLIAYFPRLDWKVSIVSPCLMLLSGDFSNVTP